MVAWSGRDSAGTAISQLPAKVTVMDAIVGPPALNARSELQLGEWVAAAPQLRLVPRGSLLELARQSRDLGLPMVAVAFPAVDDALVASATTALVPPAPCLLSVQGAQPGFDLEEVFVCPIELLRER